MHACLLMSDSTRIALAHCLYAGLYARSEACGAKPER